MNRSLRRLGQLLVVMGALLGAAFGVGLALLVENAETSKAVAAPERGEADLSPSSGQPPASRPASSPDPGDADAAAGGQGVQAADQRDDKAGKNSQDGRDKPGKAKGKDKPGKGKDK